VDPAHGDTVRDYDAQTWVGGVADDGTFHVNVRRHLPGTHELRLTVLLANGASKILSTNQYLANRSGVPDLTRLNSLQVVGPIEKLLAAGKDSEAADAARVALDELGNKKSKQNRPIAEQLEHAIALTEPHELQELGKVKGRQVFLSDVHWESASVGFGEPLRDRFYVNPREKTLKLIAESSSSSAGHCWTMAD